MKSNVQKFLQIVRRPVKFRMFLLSKLPAAYFSAMIRDITLHPFPKKSRCVALMCASALYASSARSLMIADGFQSRLFSNRFTLILD